MRIKVPKDGVVGGTPTPRNDKVASVIIAKATWTVARTKTGPNTLGRMCVNMILVGLTPKSFAA